ncbi:AraC family transcriptional regulator [Dictyobacter halimunensis]
MMWIAEQATGIGGDVTTAMELVNGMQALQVAAGWTFGEHAHNGIELVGILQGQVVLEAARCQWQVKTGQVVSIPPHLPHRWWCHEPSRLNVLHLDYTPLDLAQRLVPGNAPRLITLTKKQVIEYEGLFQRLLDLVAQSPSKQERLLKAYLEVFVLTLLEGDQVQDPTTIAMYEVAAYMQTHLDQPIAIARLAQQFLMAEVTLRRHFRAVFGVSPKQYLLDLRLKEAQHLLATTRLTLQEVAAQTCFFDLAHFSSTFRQHYHVSPSQWRAQHLDLSSPASD